MIISIIVAVLTVIIGGMFYILLMQPFQALESAMASAYPESTSILNNLNTLFLWAPVFLILIPIFVYLVIKAMEERVRGNVYP